MINTIQILNLDHEVWHLNCKMCIIESFNRRKYMYEHIERKKKRSKTVTLCSRSLGHKQLKISTVLVCLHATFFVL